jgi:DNA recombination protein RmuC
MAGFIIGFCIGAIVGAVIAIVIGLARSQADKRQMQEAFAALAAEALDANSRRLSEQAGAALESKKALIDQSVQAVNERLEQVRRFMQQIEADRKQDFGRLTGSVASLATTTGELHKMLASTQRRGAWGERMAEDVLRLVGMQEGVNYSKQSGEQAEEGSRPDFTFFLPNDLKANMDVKFPLERYKAYVDAVTDEARAGHLQQLVKAVRGHIGAVASRGYIDPKAPTVPYVIVFIPSEQIFSLVLSASPDLMDDALQQKVLLASPLTLYAMLAVIRQAAENANVLRTADQVVALVGEFSRQFVKYNDEMDKLGAKIEAASDQFQTVRSTRTNVLQRTVDKIEDLRAARRQLDDSGPAAEEEGRGEKGEARRTDA